jgi:hypothetical protein
MLVGIPPQKKYQQQHMRGGGVNPLPLGERDNKRSIKKINKNK